jgi:hypothetical protein
VEEESDIKEFEASADYAPVIARIKEMVSKPPLQKYYTFTVRLRFKKTGEAARPARLHYLL